MRNARALLLTIFVLIALVIFLLFALLRRHHTIAAVVSSQGFVGGMAEPGDTLVFTTLYHGDPGYTVRFSLKPYPCGVQDIPVTASSPGKCTVDSRNTDTPVYFFYSIISNTSQPGKLPPPSGEKPYSVVPCKLCSPIMYTGNDDARQMLLTSKTPSTHATATISCSDNATVTTADVSQNGAATLGWIAGSSWGVSGFKPDAANPTMTPPCSNGDNFSSSGTYAQCQITPNTTGKYTYSVHLDGCAKDGIGVGQLTIETASPSQ